MPEIKLQALEDPKAQEALEKGLEVLVRLNESGALEFFREASELLGDAVSYLTDPKLRKFLA